MCLLDFLNQAARELGHALFEYVKRFFKAFNVRFGVCEELVEKGGQLFGVAVQSHGQPGPDYLKLAGKAGEGDRMPATRLLVVDELPDTDLQKPVIQKFMRLYKDTYHFDRRFPINTDSGSAWDALYIVANAMKKAGANPKALRSVIEQTRGYVGISGIYNLTPEDHNGLDVDSLVMVQVRDGKFRLAD